MLLIILLLISMLLLFLVCGDKNSLISWFVVLFSPEVLLSLFMVFLVSLLVTSNNIHSLFFISTVVLFSLVWLVVVIGLEPFAYFFLIGELSALLVIYLLAFSKKIKKDSKTFSWFYLFFMFCFVIKTQETSFCFFQNNVLSYVLNDFKLLFFFFFNQIVNSLVVVLLMLILSIIVILKHRTFFVFTNPLTKNILNLYKNNISLHTKNKIKKWFSHKQ